MDRTSTRSEEPAWEVDTSKLGLEGAFAGLGALLPMAAVLYGAALFRAPVVRLPTLFGQAMLGYGPDPGYAFLGGLLAFVGLGIVTGIAYAKLVVPRTTRAGTLTGALFALIPWLFVQIVVLPLAGLGAFASRAPNGAGIVMVSLAGFVAFGAAMGAIMQYAARRTALPVLYGPTPQEA